MEYETIEAASDAKNKLNNSMIEDIKVKVEYAKKKSISVEVNEPKKKKTKLPVQLSKTLYVSNIFLVTEEDLRKTFPKAVSVKLVCDSAGDSKGYTIQ